MSLALCGDPDGDDKNQEESKAIDSDLNDMPAYIILDTSGIEKHLLLQKHKELKQ